MKKPILLIFILSTIFTYSFSQNLLSPIWKYSKSDNFKNTEDENTDKWPEVNLMLSWERQGLCSLDSNLVLKNQFHANYNSPLQLKFSLQADIQSVYINKKQIYSSISNTFWTNGGTIKTYNIPDSLLNKNAKNEVTFIVTNLSYTGGISHNFCSIQDINPGYENSLSIEFPTENHVYTGINKKQFTINSKNNTNNKLRIIIHNDFHKTLLDKKVKIQKGQQKYVYDLKTLNLEPGFYECILISKGDTYTHKAEWFAIQPEDIKCPLVKPVDFDNYWQNAIKELKAVKPNYKVTKIDSLCSATRDGYIAEMQSLNNLTIRAYYFVPKTTGKHPAILHLPGYGYGFENLKPFLDRKDDLVEMALCIRGVGISKDVFNPWDEMPMWAVDICNKKEHIYRAIYMDCISAVDFLLSRTEVDNSKIGVEGGSQGGGLALATAGLYHNHIAACAIFDPWLCDFNDQAQIRTMINKELESYKAFSSNNCDVDQMFSVIEYMDTKYFAPDITCPVHFSTSLFDDDCPPHCGFTAFNNVKTDKKYTVYPNDSHLGEHGQFENLYFIVKDMLTIK